MRKFTNFSAKLTASVVAGSILIASCAALADGKKPHHQRKIEFGLWGDMPYAKNGDATKMAALISDINNARLDFTIFDGDTKDGSSLCTDEALSTLPTALFNQINVPTVYVPGDNEWTDCHRINNGGYNALERLSFLRQNMFNSDESFGKHTMELERQGELGGAYSENTRWVRGGVVFVGLNVPGSNNNKVNDGDCISAKSIRTQPDCDADNLEYAERNAHNLAWVNESFDIAHQKGAAGVMIVIQADPGFDLPETEDVNERELPGSNGYNDLLDTLVQQCNSYDGQVVLVHGDTHFFKMDKPLIDQAHLIKNFTRLETFGSPNIHWVKVTVDANSHNVFSFEPMLVNGN